MPDHVHPLRRRVPRHVAAQPARQVSRHSVIPAAAATRSRLPLPLRVPGFVQPSPEIGAEDPAALPTGKDRSAAGGGGSDEVGDGGRGRGEVGVVPGAVVGRDIVCGVPGFMVG